MSEFKRVRSDGSEVTDLALVDDAGRVQTVPQNITTKFREAFETYTPGTRWTEVKSAGDIIMLDGNAVGASYLVISKDPLTAGSESSVTTIDTFDMPLELATGLHLSQRTLGQEFSVEVVSNEPAVTPIADIAIANLSQATTVLTVNTTAAHGLKPGARIGIVGNPDSRANYPALVVASIPSPTQFTATAGPGGNITSLTYGPVSGGSVFVRSATGYARNAVSMIFENASATNASFYVKTEAGDVHPAGGAVNGNHSVTVGSTSSVQAINTAYTYAFAPTTEFRLTALTDRVQWSDAGIDSLSATSSRSLRTQVIPDNRQKYKLRFRAVNSKSLPVPIAQIVSVAKTGTTTATVTTDVAHGLTVADQIAIYGVRDQTNFANSTGMTVSGIISATQFNVVFGIAATATSYGGFVSRSQGSTNIQGLAGQVAQSVSVASGVLTVIGSAAWAGLLIGDLVNTVGFRDNTTGATLGLEGAWRVRNVSTTTLELEPVGTTAVPGNLASTNCGGAIIRRTDLRISFLRMFDFERQRVEMLPRPLGDAAAAMPVIVEGFAANINATQSSRGTVGSGWNVNPDNLLVNDIVSAALTTTTTTAITPATTGGVGEFNVIVTAVTGTTPTLDVGIEESDDTGTNWIRIYDFPRITATGAYRTPPLLLNGNRIRYVQTVGGTTPSFTRAVNRVMQWTMSPPNNTRQIIDRTLDVNTQGAATGILVNSTGAANVAFYVNGGTYTTGPTLQLQGSFDGVLWFPYGNTLALTSGQTGMTPVSNAPFQFFRVYVQTAGTGGTVGQTVTTLRTY